MGKHEKKPLYKPGHGKTNKNGINATNNDTLCTSLKFDREAFVTRPEKFCLRVCLSV